MFITKYLGTKEYYQKLFKVAIPLALTMLLQSCMSIVDSIMVSSIGMVTAVGNAGNIFQLHDGINWGISSGISTFAAQFYGSQQKENMARTYGLSIILMSMNSLIWIFAVYIFGNQILSFYLNDQAITYYSLIYIKIAVLSLIPRVFNFSCSVMYRSMHNTRLPFYFSTFGALLNIALNYYFIFIIKIGVAGAAYGTCISQIVVSGLYIFVMFKYKPYFFVINKIFDINFKFAKPVLNTMYPLMINETLFGFGMTLFNKAYGLLGTQAMDAIYVANQVFNMFTFIIWGYGNAISILIGTKLGEGDIDEAIKESRYQVGSAFIIGTAISLSMAAFAPLYLKFFNISSAIVYTDARNILYVFAFKGFLRIYTYMMFSTLKAGGDTRILNLYDSGFMYLIGLPIAFGGAIIGINNIALLVFVCQIEQLIRVIFCFQRFNSNIWAKNLTKLVDSNS